MLRCLLWMGWLLCTGHAWSTPVFELTAEPRWGSPTDTRVNLTLLLAGTTGLLRPQHMDTQYTASTDYLGYFDSGLCYRYVQASPETLSHFERDSVARNRSCGGRGFSGNFLNWATMSVLDLLRMGLTGGDRSTDTEQLTLLQRAVLPESSFSSLGIFAPRKLSSIQVPGALPSAMMGSHRGDVWVSNCLARVHFGTDASGSCAEPGTSSNLGSGLGPARNRLTSDPFFLVRVRVCDSSESSNAESRRSFCEPYPLGNFKPVGLLQRQASRLRVGLLSYLLDDRSQRYGGVLRSPLAPIGATDNSIATSSGYRAEWQASSGVLRQEADASGGLTGVILAINTWGRSGSSPGRYRYSGPLAELYYEGLRYLQGLAPTPQALADVTAEMRDGLSVVSSWGDPYPAQRASNYSCVNNHLAVISDGITDNDKSIPGNTTLLNDNEFARAPNPSGNEPDFPAWTRVVAGFEARVAVPYVDGSGNASRSTMQPEHGNPANAAAWGMESRESNPQHAGFHLAGMAYWGRSHDIRQNPWTERTRHRPGLRVGTHVLHAASQAGTPSSVVWLAAKYGGFMDRSPQSRGNPFLDETGATDNSGWARDEASGQPRNYTHLATATDTLQGLSRLLTPAPTVERSMAALATNLADPARSEELLFQALFDSSTGSGDLQAIPVPSSADTPVGAARWSAARLLDRKPPAERRIFVGRTSPRASPSATEFLWERLDADLAQALDRPTPSAGIDGLGPARLAYLRGERQGEKGPFRPRTHVLGSIVHAGSAYSGTPPARWNEADFAAFAQRSDIRQRRPAVFAGANDGMLHAFDALSGEELFAYVPSWLVPQLPQFTGAETSPGPRHAGVDSPVAVAEARVGSDWKTVLVGGTGAGGQGVYALDVSLPQAFGAQNVLWEFTDRDDADLGHVLSAPQVLKLRTSAPGRVPQFKWFAVVPGGVNAQASDGQASVSGQPAVFLLDLAKPVGTSWSLGRNYFKLLLPVDANLSTSMPSGVVSLKAVGGSAGEVTQLYVGDLHGQLWKLDFSRAGSTGWNFDNLVVHRDLTGPVPLLRARDGQGRAQPISVEPAALYGPNGASFVVVATGRALQATDLQTGQDAATQSIYVLLDESGAGSVSGRASALTRSQLQSGVADPSTGSVRVAPFAWGHAGQSSALPVKSGWVIDFPTPGERQIFNFSTFGSTLLLNSFIPTDGSLCASPGGRSYTVDLATGNGSSVVSAIGALGQVITLADTSRPVAGTARVRQSRRSIRVLLPGTSGLRALDSPLQRPLVTGRLSWRRIPDYLQLRSSPP